MKFIISVLVLLLSLTASSQSDDEKIFGAWELIEEKGEWDDEDLPSIIGAPEVPEKRNLILNFKAPSTLVYNDRGSEETTTFILDGRKLFLGTREYRLKRLNKTQLVYFDNGPLVLDKTLMIFNRLTKD